jgi:hypothetical protein
MCRFSDLHVSATTGMNAVGSNIPSCSSLMARYACAKIRVVKTVGKGEEEALVLVVTE